MLRKIIAEIKADENPPKLRSIKEKPTTVVGENLSRKSRLKDRRPRCTSGSGEVHPGNPGVEQET